MASSVFYKFKNSKEPERITFDGTGISVFELKREIITASGLGDGSDFDLHIYPEDSPKEEYNDDTTIISRSSTVIAVRRPAARGHGRAARYVSGRAPVRAIKKADHNKPVTSAAGGAGFSEADAEAAFLAESAQVWDQQKETLSHAKPVYRQKKPINVPTHEPPPGYLCYRCQKKGHWIQACPTNDDPDFKPVPRAKRTTGIPQSFLQKIAKPTEDELEDSRGIMLNAEGEYVKVMQDTRTWEKFQEKANASKAQAANADAANKEIRERGLECSIDKRMFVDPVKTPCCGTTYCHDCIENALAEADLTCPNCSTEGVLIDNLSPDEDMVEKIRTFRAEKAEEARKEQQVKEKAKAAAKPSSPSNNESVSVPPSTDETAKTSERNQAGSKSPKQASSGNRASSSDVKSPLTVAASTTKPAVTAGAGGNNSDTDTSSTSKKRKTPPTEIKPPTAPKAMRQKKELEAKQIPGPADVSSLLQSMGQQVAAVSNIPPIMPNMAMGMSMGMPANPMLGMAMPPNMHGMNPMNGGMNGYGNMNMNQWNGYPNQGFQNMYNNNMGGYNNMNGGYGNMGYGGGGMNGMNGMNGNMGAYGAGGGAWNQGGGQYGGHMGYQQNMPNSSAPFPNQQRTTFSEQPNDKDAYERKPLNPQRSQNRARRTRPVDQHFVNQSSQI
ncbi:DWNN domain-domain-containing protein [Clohesyomyces aquaticus]|uniref:DWNN domain-domain-containing protein n=1 Tax=Clohesyomyces aquaticus TaxID=1231657 RepID=A0A1Y2A0T5_9PLEO|nr:DWNN domain-domain-containing protein [Clohesyomyces aquaticus]